MNAVTIERGACLAPPLVVGAVVRIVAAGAGSAPERDQRQASGLSAYLWNNYRDQIAALLGDGACRDQKG